MKKITIALLSFFFALASLDAQVIITEIMYNPPQGAGTTDTLEFVELHNRGNMAVDVSGWQFNEGFEFTFPAGTSIPGGGYVIITENKAYFDARFPGLTTFEWSGALTNSPGEDLELTTSDTNNVVDYVDYRNVAPWPAGDANGNGASIVLCDFNSDNSNGANWQTAKTATSVVIGGLTIKATPGAAGGCQTGSVAYPQYSIAQVTGENANTGVADSLGKKAEIRGIVHGVNLRATISGLQFTIIDNTNTAGVTVFSQTATYGYTVAEGDEIVVRGTVNQFNGLTQLAPDTLFKTASNQTLATPAVVNQVSEATESRLVRINNLVLVDPLAWTGMGSGFTALAIRAGSTDTIAIRVDNDVTLFSQPAPTTPFDMIGIGGQFDSSNPFTSGYQLQPRYTADLIPVSSTYEADFSGFVRLQPNPFYSQLTITAETDFDAVQLYNSTGQLMYRFEQPGRRLEIPASHFTPGVYYVRFEKDGKFWTGKMVRG